MSFAFLVLGMGFGMAILAFVSQISYCKSDKIIRERRNNLIENELSSKIIISSIDVNKRRPIKGESDNVKKKIIEAASHETGLLVGGTDNVLKVHSLLVAVEVSNEDEEKYILMDEETGIIPVACAAVSRVINSATTDETIKA